MCICMCMCMCMCMCECVCVCACACGSARVCVYVYVYVYMWLCMCMCVWQQTSRRNECEAGVAAFRRPSRLYSHSHSPQTHRRPSSYTTLQVLFNPPSPAPPSLYTHAHLLLQSITDEIEFVLLVCYFGVRLICEEYETIK